MPFTKQIYKLKGLAETTTVSNRSQLIQFRNQIKLMYKRICWPGDIHTRSGFGSWCCCKHKKQQRMGPATFHILFYRNLHARLYKQRAK